MKLPSVIQLTEELSALEARMSELAMAADSSGQMQELAGVHSHKTVLRDLLVRREKLLAEQADLDALLASDSEDMVALAEEERSRITTELADVERELELALIPPDPRDARNIILEIRAGAGGEEAALFAAELFRSYTRYAEAAGWSVHTVSSALSEQGGFKEVVAEISGEQVFGSLKFERGVHRVQRVPETEKQGRIHTSTVTVAVLPQAEAVDIEIKTEDLRIDTYRASGAGGQHVNKTSSAVRITHVPTNTVIAVQDERSQHKNKEKAMRILRARLLEAQEEAQRSAEATARRAQVGTGDRSEKIRTYNFPQDRITDHRIKKSWSDIPRVLDGQWQPIFAALQEADRQMRIQAAT